MNKINAAEKAINIIVPKSGMNKFIQKPDIISIFQEDTGKIKYVHNVLEYRPKQIKPEEVRALFENGKIGARYFKQQMYRIKIRLFLKSLRDSRYYKQWKNTVDLSRKITFQDCKEISDFMNMHNGKFINVWKGVTLSDDIPNIENWPFL